MRRAEVELGRAFRAAGLDSPGLDARLLVCAATGLSREDLVRSPERPLTDREQCRLADFAGRRMRREPVARILGRREFWSLDFALAPSTLVPRPETETLVEAALDYVDARGYREGAWRIADLGTGSGCLLVSLLRELPRALGTGVDIDANATDVARANAERHRVADRAVFVVGRWADALSPGLDIIVANPPYIASSDFDALSPEVRDHDPLLALDGGSDGLRAYCALIEPAAQALRPGGVLIVEAGRSQAPTLSRFFHQAGLAPVEFRYDLSGIARAVVGCRPW